MAARLKKRKLNIVSEENTSEAQVIEKSDLKAEQDISELKESLAISDDPETGNIKKSEIIDLNDKSKGENTAIIDFSDQKFLDDLVSKKTKKVDEEDDGENDFKGKTNEEVKKLIDNAENSQDENWTPDDFLSVADIIITILDTFLSNMLRVYAKDTKDSEYCLNDKKRKLLVKQLAAILIKYQAKFKVEFLFILSLILFYAAPVIAARNRRKRMKQIEKEVALAKQEGRPVEEAIKVAEMKTNINAEKNDIVEEAIVISEQEENIIKNNLPADLKPKRGRGGSR